MTRVTSQGFVTVQISVITKDLRRLGYETSPQRQSDQVPTGPAVGLEIGGQKPPLQKQSSKQRESTPQSSGSNVQEM